MLRRYKTVWYHIILPLTVWIYLPLYLNVTPFLAALQYTALAFGAVVLTGASGYVLNDLFDTREDKLANKPNFFNALGRVSFPLAFLLTTSTVLCWYLLSPPPVVLWLLVTQVLLLLFYSLPAIRLKKHLAGVLADALYSRVVPSMVILLLGMGFGQYFGPFFWVALVSWQLLVGLRNILLHQIEDRKKDRLSNNGNWVLSFGPLKTQHLILRFLVPLEILLLVLWGITLWPILPGAPLVLVFTLLLVAFLLKFWERHRLTIRIWKHKTMYLPNWLYEEWMPIIAIILLTTHDSWFLILLALHMGLFYQPWPKYLKSLLALLYLIRLMVSRVINYTLYYLFRLFKVDLEKEQTSAWGYIAKRMQKKS